MAGVKAVGAGLLLVVVAVALSCASVDARTTPSGHGSDEITEIRFYTRVEKEDASTVFGPAPTKNSNRNFGKGTVKDYAVLSYENERESGNHGGHSDNEREEEIGRARGLSFYDSLDGQDVEHFFSVSFEKGQHSGSSLVFAGHAKLDRNRVELAIIGGTGQFSFSRGYAKLQRLEQERSSDRDSQEADYEITVYLKDVSQKEEERRTFF